jgi:predicted transcriptional regulator YheO
MESKKVRGRRKSKFKQVNFKLTTNQMEALQEYCDNHDTSPIRLIKDVLKPYLNKKTHKDIPSENDSENQMDLLSMIEEVKEISIRESLEGPEAWERLTKKDFPKDLFS